MHDAAPVVDMAVNARGDAVVAWATRRHAAGRPVRRTTVYVAVRTANGRLRTRRLWSGVGSSPSGISVAIDRHGEITVAWIARTRRAMITPGGAGRVRTAYGPIVGRWARPRSIGEGLQSPRLAVAPDGDVLLVWVDGDRRLRLRNVHRIGVAWRRAGHRFGRRGALSSPRLNITDYSKDEAVTVFDAHGSAYLTNPCDGAVRMTRPHSHRFGRPIAVAPGFALGFSLSVTTAGQGLASWVAGRCSANAAAGDTPGPAFARVLSAGTFGPPLALPSTANATATNALIVPGGGRIVSWSEWGIERSGVFSVPVGEDGPLGPAEPIADGMIPFLADGGGDQVLARVFPGPPDTFGTGGTAVRPAEGGPDQPSPAPHGGQTAVSAPIGRRVAVLWSTSTTGMALSVWRP